MKTTKKLDRSLAVAALALLAVGHGLFGAVFLLVGSNLAIVASAFEGALGATAAVYVLPVVGVIALALCGALLHASTRVGLPGATGSVLATLAVTALVDSPVLWSTLVHVVTSPSKGTIGSFACLFGAFAIVLHTVWTHERARVVSVRA